MLKRIISLFLMLCMVLAIFTFSYASTTQVSQNSSLYIANGAVHCEGEVAEDGATIDLTMKLSRNGRIVRTWSESDTDFVLISGSYNATSGSIYQLSFVCYVNGNRITMPTKTITCP